MKSKSPQLPELIIGIRPLADALGVGESRIHDYIRSGMPAVKLFGRWHFHRDAVFGWFRELSVIAAKRENRVEDLTEEEIE